MPSDVIPEITPPQVTPEGGQRTFYHLSTPICQILSPLHNRLTMKPARIIARPMTQHGHEDTQQSIAKSA